MIYMCTLCIPGGTSIACGGCGRGKVELRKVVICEWVVVITMFVFMASWRV